MKKKMKGFTLVELVVVIAIILILVAIAVPRFSKSNLSAQAATHNVNVREIKNAAVLFISDNPEKTGDISADLAEYFENNKLPKPAKAIEGSNAEFSVVYDGTNIKVTPAEVKVSGDKLVVDGESN